jgi:tight adherence protein B
VVRGVTAPTGVAVAAATIVAVAGVVVRRLLLAGTRSAIAARLSTEVWPHRGHPGSGAGGSPAWFARLLDAAAVDGDPGAWWRRWTIGSAVLTPTAALAGGAGAGALVAVASALAVPAGLHGLGHRRGQQLEASLPPLLDVTAAALRSGASLPQALAAAATRPGRLAAELDDVVVAVDRGAPLVAELDRWVLRRPLPGLRLAVTALALGADAGGPRAPAVDGVADTLRDRLALRREVTAQSAQARASALVMTAVPVVVAILAGLSDPRTGAFLFRTWPGLLCVLAGLGLDGAAGLWMLRLIRDAAR